jgi:hypothetical protein
VDLSWQSRGALTTAWSSGPIPLSQLWEASGPVVEFSRAVRSDEDRGAAPPGDTGLLRPRSGARQSLNREWLLQFEDTRGVEDTATDMLLSTRRNKRPPARTSRTAPEDYTFPTLSVVVPVSPPRNP